MKKLIALSLALVMCLFSFVACGEKADSENNDSDLAYVQDKGEIVVGITYLEPLDFQDENKAWIGFDAEVATAVAEKLGVKVKFQEISWEAKETELASKNIDCIWNGLTITPTRQAEMSISNPYMLNKQVLVVRADDAASYTDVDALAGKTIAAEAGSAGESVVLDKVADAVYVEKGIQLDALTEVKALTADAAIIDYVMAYYLINKEGSAYADLQIIDMDLSEDEFYGIAFRRGSDMTAKVNEVLAELEKDGTIGAIAEKYALTDALVALGK